MSTDQIALELYSIRDRTASDMLGALREVADIGFPAVEFAGYGSASVPEIRRTLDEVGLKAVSAHVPMQRFAQEFDTLMDELHTLGCTNAVVPWVAEEWRDAAGIARLADRFNEFGARCREAGIRFGYHNHDFEFAVVDGSTLLDHLIDATDPALVAIQLDYYFFAEAGADGAEATRRLAGRVPTLHIKDFSGSAGKDAAFGAGTIDWDPILAAAAESGTEWYIIEQEDHPLDLAGALHRLGERLGPA